MLWKITDLYNINKLLFVVSQEEMFCSRRMKTEWPLVTDSAELELFIG